MPDFARRLIAAYRGTPEETEEFWGDLERAELDLMEPYSPRSPEREYLTNGRSHMLGHCGRHTLATDPDQDEVDPWEDYR